MSGLMKSTWFESQTELAFTLMYFASKNMTRYHYLPLGILLGEASLSFQGTQQAASVSDKTQVLRQKLEK